jgi:rhodanese-related sulfurtransferase
MKTYLNPFVFLFLLVLASIGCTGKNSNSNNNLEGDSSVKSPVVLVSSETAALLKELRESGDYVNSVHFPSIIKASLVNEGLPGKNLIIDIRSPGQFADGHIKSAVNKQFGELPAYFESEIKPFEYDKIILVCDDGQLSGYATSILRLKGYGNVYSIRWGMSSWNSVLAEKSWLAGLSGEYEPKLDTVTTKKPGLKEMPALQTGAQTGKDVADAMFEKLFAEEANDVLITAEEVFKDPANYFIINMERKDKYESGHIPGAVRYKPDGTLGFTDEMATIPSDKTVVVYCGTGHNSAFATAYLRLFGYDARTLRYGNNSFMYDRMVNQKSALSWLPFTKEEINDFAVVR